MRHRIVIAVLALVPLHVAAFGVASAKEPLLFPKDGLEEKSVGIPGLPLELKDGNGDVHRRKAKPFAVGVGMVVRWGVEFEYPYADAAVEKAALDQGRAIGIQLRGFLDPGLAHRWLFERFSERMPEEYEVNAPVRPWNDGRERASLPGLFFQGTSPTAVGLEGIVRHTFVEVTWDRRPSRDKGGEEPDAVKEMRKRTTATCEAIIRAVREAPAAESPDARTVTRVTAESVASRRNGPRNKMRLMASARVAPDKKSWLPATMFVENGVYTNMVAGVPTGSLMAESNGGVSGNLDDVPIYCVDEGPVFHLFRITKFHQHPILGYAWP